MSVGRIHVRVSLFKQQGRHEHAFSRLMRPSFKEHSPRIEGAGKAGYAMRTRSLAWCKKTRELVTTGSPANPAFPAQWF